MTLQEQLNALVALLEPMRERECDCIKNGLVVVQLQALHEEQKVKCLGIGKVQGLQAQAAWEVLTRERIQYVNGVSGERTLPLRTAHVISTWPDGAVRGMYEEAVYAMQFPGTQGMEILVRLSSEAIAVAFLSALRGLLEYEMGEARPQYPAIDN